MSKNKTVIKLYDNGGATADRYTAVYLQDPQRTGRMYGARGMCSNPTSPQGIGQYTTAQDGSHLGRKIKYEDLPVACRNIVLRDLSEYMFDESDEVMTQFAKAGVGKAALNGLDFDPINDESDNKKLRAKLAQHGIKEQAMTNRTAVSMMAALGALK